ncbi:DUF308 domain-containing protein [Bradyrhizobium japonicum]|uniref:DUF308 domain-containing protein n=1 Tax=Bradyrhizobium japonicum TaxID=375 RepID=UPI00209DF2E6|nr:DUF308 domain-containing protein [Bradyrhizobium japonicum]MCP1767807.1 hypothetical protein [Bradyrhizobium japonicum]MCP1789949.1 hypothetical protein [Bradyrhizobium japonicum]MCP1802445.1 hypothetical protein [Bradyrhizobium japonicum]MCP1820756.1 hypothetical protein [Bradyrhizobium japonicum]MCP1867737.1 hypothetical protein [Bradyrhizobium japonicum]
MSLALLIVGIFAVLAGLLTILFGFTVREFSLGSTLIIAGTIGVCSGMLLAGLHVVVVELKGIARRLAGSAAPGEVRVRPVLPGLAVPGAPVSEPFPAPATKNEPPPPPAVGLPPWQSEAAARERPRAEPPPEPEAPTPPAAPEAPRRRNLLFASSSRKERERAEAKATESLPPQPHDEPAEPAAPESQPASFDDAWPRPDRMRPPEPPAAGRRPPPRSPSPFAEPGPPPPPPEPAPAVEQAPVTVLKSGIVDGMAYSLYSDGSIEAQMPEGMMRFASIDELRAHLDQRS